MINDVTRVDDSKLPNSNANYYRKILSKMRLPQEKSFATLKESSPIQSQNTRRGHKTELDVKGCFLCKTNFRLSFNDVVQYFRQTHNIASMLISFVVLAV